MLQRCCVWEINDWIFMLEWTHSLRKSRVSFFELVSALFSSVTIDVNPGFIYGLGSDRIDYFMSESSQNCLSQPSKAWGYFVLLHVLTYGVKTETYLIYYQKKKEKSC